VNDTKFSAAKPYRYFILDGRIFLLHCVVHYLVTTYDCALISVDYGLLLGLPSVKRLNGCVCVCVPSVKYLIKPFCFMVQDPVDSLTRNWRTFILMSLK